MKRIGTVASTLAALALVCGLTAGAAGPARADVIPPSGTWAEITAPYTATHSLCLDDPSGSATVGTQLQIFHCHGYASNGLPQRWYFSGPLILGPGDAVYEINTKYGLCVGADLNHVQLASARVIMDTCWFLGPSWNFLNPGPSSPARDFELELADTGYCMTLPNPVGINGDQIRLEPCDPGNYLQHWNLG